MTAPVKHVWIALAVVYVVWGSTYFGIKIAVETIPPLLAAGSRFLVAGVASRDDPGVARHVPPDRAPRAGWSCDRRGPAARARRGSGARRGDEDRLERRRDDRRHGSAADHRATPARRREPRPRHAAQHSRRSVRADPRSGAGARRRLDRARPRRDDQRIDVVDAGLVPVEAAPDSRATRSSPPSTRWRSAERSS